MSIISKNKIWLLRYLCLALLSLFLVMVGSRILSSKIALNSEDKVSASNHTAQISSSWQSVTIGGGGYITGIYPHPQEPDLVYVRTDNGGYYRWQPKQQQWLPITDSLPRESWDYDGYSGGESLALDPQNPDVVYIAVGKYSDRPGTIFKSEDRGVTWQGSDLAVAMGGDEEKRWAGNRLVVSPVDSNLLLFGSRKEGLWRSLDGGISWNQMSDLALVSDSGIGVTAIAFAPQNLVYASVYNDGVYQSIDDGLSWRKTERSPSGVMQLGVANNGTVYATSDRAPQVSKYAGETWTDISPKGVLVHNIFNGLSLHPQDANTLMVSEGEKGKAKIYYSRDGGASWSKKNTALNKNIPWLAPEFFQDHTAAIAFDPQAPQKAWLTDWFSIWHTDNITGNTVTWKNRVAGIEQTVLFTLAAPPQGTVLLSGLADQDGFYHHDLKDYPQDRLGFEPQKRSWGMSPLSDRYLDNYFQDTHHIAYCQNAAQHLVRVGSQRWRDRYLGVTSQDGGITWQPWANIPANKMFMRVAISATDPRRFVVTTSEDQPLVTDDGGASWQSVSGLPDGETGPWNWNQPLAADGANGDRFYYYGAGKVYRSNDGGKSFQVAFQDFPETEKYILTTVPGNEGEIWLSLDRGGLYHSLNGGRSFDKVESVTEAHLVTIGLPLTISSNPGVYVYGTLANGQSGLFVSSNSQDEWLQLSSKFDMPRTTIVLTTSKQQPGLLFAGTDGRGIYYKQINTSQF